MILLVKKDCQACEGLEDLKNLEKDLRVLTVDGENVILEDGTSMPVDDRIPGFPALIDGLYVHIGRDRIINHLNSLHK
jgi:hypothetical protein